MYKVTISTDSSNIEIREKVFPQKPVPLAPGLSIESMTEHPDTIILRIEGKDYEIDQYDFNQAVKPFLYCDGQLG